MSGVFVGDRKRSKLQLSEGYCVCCCVYVFPVICVAVYVHGARMTACVKHKGAQSFFYLQFQSG